MWPNDTVDSSSSEPNRDGRAKTVDLVGGPLAVVGPVDRGVRADCPRLASQADCQYPVAYRWEVGWAGHPSRGARVGDLGNRRRLRHQLRHPQMDVDCRDRESC